MGQESKYNLESSPAINIFAARVRSTTGGYVFAGVSVHGRGGTPWPLVPDPGGGGGVYRSQICSRRGTPVRPVAAGGGYP